MKSVEVIIVENIPTLGQIGDIVKVRAGYARNYLIPRGLAVPATGKNIKELEHQKRMLARKRELFRQHLMGMAERLNGVTVSLKRKVTEGNKLYGSVSAMDILEVLHDMGFRELNRRSVLLEQPIKTTGEFDVPIKIDAEIKSHIKVIVEPEG
ncbi:MAG: 50S ribosomal protein L9 [Syntrophobacterales bacterium]|nr:50S ribosomal protein L9 [Syntrophobacterales bacterium]